MASLRGAPLASGVKGIQRPRAAAALVVRASGAQGARARRRAAPARFVWSAGGGDRRWRRPALVAQAARKAPPTSPAASPLHPDAPPRRQRVWQVERQEAGRHVEGLPRGAPPEAAQAAAAQAAAAAAAAAVRRGPGRRRRQRQRVGDAGQGGGSVHAGEAQPAHRPAERRQDLHLQAWQQGRPRCLVLFRPKAPARPLGSSGPGPAGGLRARRVQRAPAEPAQGRREPPRGPPSATPERPAPHDSGPARCLPLSWSRRPSSSRCLTAR